MKRRSSATVGLAALTAFVTLQPVNAQEEILKPFRPDDGRPVMRATPVRPPKALPADAVEDGTDLPPGVQPGRGTPPQKGIPVRRAKAVKATPEPLPPRQTPPPPAPEPADPGEIRLTPQAGTKSPDQVQIDVADNYYGRKMYEMAAPEYQRYLEQYPGLPDMQMAYFRLAQCYQKMGSVNAAKVNYEMLLDRFQAGEFIGPAAYFLAKLYYEEKNYASALPLYRKASVRLKNPAEINSAKFFTARCLEFQGPLYKLEARAVYEELSETKENNIFQEASRLSYAIILHEGKNTAEALKQMQLLLKQTQSPEMQAEAAVHAGMWEVELGQTEKGAADLKKALEQPAIGRWREVAELGIVQTYYRAGKYKQVLDAYADLTKGQDPPVQFSAETRPELLLMVGDSQCELAKYAEALPIYDQVIREYPNSAYAKESAYQRLVCFYRSSDPKLGSEIDSYLANNPETEKRDQVLLMKAESLYKKQDFQGAVPIYDQLAKSVKLSGTLRAEALFKCGWCLVQVRDVDRAIKAFSQFIEDFPTNKSMPYALIQRALAYQSQKNFAAAEKDFDAIIRKYPSAAKERELALQQEALMHGQENDPAGMAQNFEQLLKDYPKSSEAGQAHYWLGRAAFDAKDYQKAAPHLDQARELDKEQYFEPATLRILLCYYYQEDKAGVAREIDRYNKSGKTKVPVEVLRWLGEQLAGGGAPESAEKYLAQLAAREDAQPKDHLLLGKTQLALGKFKGAKGSLEKYLEIVHEPPTRALGLIELGKAEIGMKSFDAAQKSVDEVLTLQPEGKLSGEGRILAGQIQEARGNYEEAAKVYVSVSVILDDEEITPRALDLAVKAYERAGKSAEAKKTLNTLQSRYPEYIQKGLSAQ